MIGHYDWAGGTEAMLRFGPDHGPVVVVAPPLLEEWNRTRAFTVTLLRELADRGIAGALPDLPGHGESLATVDAFTIPRLADAVTAATAAIAGGRPTFGVALRSGALVVHHAPCWHFAPVTGTGMLQDLHRIRLAERPGERSRDAMMAGATIAGTTLSAGFLASLTTAEPGPADRVVRLATDPRPADRHVDGLPLWRRTEPSNDLALAETLADDIAAWVATCAA